MQIRGARTVCARIPPEAPEMLRATPAADLALARMLAQDHAAPQVGSVPPR
jgi:hypothetical protein